MDAPLRIAIAGLGTVGRGVVKTLTRHNDLIAQRSPRPIEIVAVSARDREADRGIDLSGLRWVEDARELALANDVDVVVELIGGAEGIAKDVVTSAIGAGKDVVTANKALLAVHGETLALAADSADVALRYEAAVAGGIPLIKGLREGLSGNAVTRITGILNGTCNYILTQMEDTGADFGDVLQDAQAKGYAEADPGVDIGGVDAAHKIAILAALAFGAPVPFDKVHVEGIEAIEADDIRFAAELGYRIKLLATAEWLGHGRIGTRVHPALVRQRSPLAEVGGVMNAALVEAEPVQRVLFEGPGAGEGPTASAVVADLIDLARGLRLPVYMPAGAERLERTSVPIEDHVGAFYVRLKVIDQPGVMARITQILSESEISIESILQRGRRPNGVVPVVMVTHEAKDAVMAQAIAQFAALEAVTDDPCLIRIENV